MYMYTCQPVNLGQGFKYKTAHMSQGCYEALAWQPVAHVPTPCLNRHTFTCFYGRYMYIKLSIPDFIQ